MKNSSRVNRLSNMEKSNAGFQRGDPRIQQQVPPLSSYEPPSNAGQYQQQPPLTQESRSQNQSTQSGYLSFQTLTMNPSREYIPSSRAAQFQPPRDPQSEQCDVLTTKLQNMTVYDNARSASCNKVNYHSQATINSQACSSQATGRKIKLTNTNEILTYDDEYTPYPMLTSPMRINPPSTPDKLNTRTASTFPRLSQMCMGSDRASFPRDYYTHPSVPAFLICTWCYSQYIQPTSLTPHFPTSNVVRKSNVGCMFHIPRVTKSLWPGAVRTGDLSALLDFMKRRSFGGGDGDVDGNSQFELGEIRQCRGHGVGVWSYEGVKWFSTARAEDMPGFVACEACFEDFILATPFGNKFVPRVQEECQSWACDVANKYIKRVLLQAGMRNDWDGFVEKANMRVMMGSKVSSCFGLKREVMSCRWWSLKGYAGRLRGSDGEGVFVMCGPCYMDEVGGSRFEGLFEEVGEVDSNEEDWAFNHCSLERRCSFAGNHPVKNALRAAESRKLSPDKLKGMLEVIVTKPRCGAEDGIGSGLFYNFCEGYEVEDFGVCVACYVGTMAGFGMHRYLADQPFEVQGQAYCIFHPLLPRTQQFIDRMNESIDTGNFSVYHQYVHKFLSIPPCPGRGDVENCKWHGWPDCTICPDCFETFARGTALAKDMPYQSQLLEGPEICSMYSDRQRSRYLAACETGNVEELLAATRERTLVWHQTVPKMVILSSEAQLAFARAQVYQSSGSNYAMLDALSFGESGTKYSTSAGNTYQTYDGVMAEEMAAESDEFYEEARGIGQTAEIFRLQELWARIE